MALTRYIMGAVGAHNDALSSANTGSNGVVNTGGSGVLSNAESNPIGSLAAVMTATTTSGAHYFYKSGMSTNNFCFDVLFKVKTEGGQAAIVWGGTGSQEWQIDYNPTTNKLEFKDDGSVTRWTSTPALTVGTWYWLRGYVVNSGTVGQFHVTLADASAPSTLLEDYTSAASIDTGGTAYTDMRMGVKSSTGTQTGVLVIGSWAYDPAATDLPPIYMLDPPTLVVSQPANNVVDVRGSTDGDGTSITYLDPVEVTSTGTTPVELVAGVWLFDTTDDSTWTVGVTQGDLQEDTQNVDIAATGAAGTRNPKMPSGAHPGTTWA